MDLNDIRKKEEEINLRSKQKLDTLSAEEKQALAKKQKKRYIIGIVVCLALLAVMLVLLLIPDETKTSWSVILGWFFCAVLAIITVDCIVKMCKPTDALALTMVKREVTEVVNGEYKAKEAAEQIIDPTFNTDKIINIDPLGKQKFYVDNINKKFLLQKGGQYTKAYKFSDIINYEVNENGSSVVKGTAGKALIGGAFFGLGGMIVGSSMSRNVKENCNMLQLIIRINDLDNPQLVLSYIDGTNWDKNGTVYKQTVSDLHRLCSMLEVMINGNEGIKTESAPAESIVQSKTETPTASTKEQLKELKELLDEGLITQEEFELKKKQILGL